MFTTRPHILITNDDGVHASGIKHLWKALSPHAHVTVVAPAYEQSAMGLSTTVRFPLRIDKISWGIDSENIWSVNGTPADCVKLALNAVLTRRPDMIISGINRGANLGRGVLYSGTVAAAIESIMQEIPSIAFSCQDYHTEPDYAAAAKYVPFMIKHVLKHPLPSGTLLNVNFPERSIEIKGFKMTHQGREWWAENPYKREHPDEGHSYYWLGAKLRMAEEDDGEGAWMRRGYITAVPIHVGDLTDRRYLESCREVFESGFSNK